MKTITRFLVVSLALLTLVPNVLAQVTPRWNADLHDYLDHFAVGHLDTSLQRELHRLTLEHLLSSPRP